MRPANACPSSGMRSESDLAGALDGLFECVGHGANELGPGVGGGLRLALRKSIAMGVVEI